MLTNSSTPCIGWSFWARKGLLLTERTSLVVTRPVGSQAELEARRRLAVALLRLGHGAYEVADVVGVSPSSVYRWKEAYEGGGDEGLDAKPHKGGPSAKLSDEQLTALAALLLEGPQAHGFDMISGRSNASQQ